MTYTREDQEAALKAYKKAIEERLERESEYKHLRISQRISKIHRSVGFKHSTEYKKLSTLLIRYDESKQALKEAKKHVKTVREHDLEVWTILCNEAIETLYYDITDIDKLIMKKIIQLYNQKYYLFEDEARKDYHTTLKSIYLHLIYRFTKNTFFKDQEDNDIISVRVNTHDYWDYDSGHSEAFKYTFYEGHIDHIDDLNYRELKNYVCFATVTLLRKTRRFKRPGGVGGNIEHKGFEKYQEMILNVLDALSSPQTKSARAI